MQLYIEEGWVGSVTATSDPQAEGDLQQIVSQLTDDFAPRNTLYAEIDRVVYLDKPVSIPESYAEAALEVRAPAALNVVNTVTAALSINPPTVQFRPTSMGLGGERNATLRNHYFMGSWRRQEEEAGRRIFRAAMHACVTYGEGIVKTLERTKTAWAAYGGYQRNLKSQLDAEVAAGSLDSDSATRVFNAKTEEYKRGLAYPIVSIDVHPQQFYYVKGTSGFTLCVERSRIPYYDAYAKFRAGINGDGKIMPEAAALSQLEWQRRLGGQTSLELTEVWDLDYVYYLLRGPGDAADRVVKKLRHGYGNKATGSLRGPYFHSFGLMTSARLPERMGLGLVFGYLKLFGLLDSLLTIMGQAAYQGGWTTYGRRTPATGGLGVADPGTAGLGPDELEQNEVIKFEPGMIYPYELVAVEPPAITANVDKMLAEVQSIIKQALPDVVQGVMQGGDSGYAINQATHLARLIWDPIVDNMEIQSKYDLRNETTTAGAYTLARAMDVQAANLFPNNTTQSVGSLGSELTVDNLLRARQFMRDSASKGPWYGCVSPATYTGFLKVDMFTNQLYNGDDNGSALHQAKVGRLFNADFYESQLLSGTAPNSTGAFWDKSHYFKIVQRKPTTHTWYSPLDLAWVVSMDVIYGAFERLEPDEGGDATTNSRLWGVRLQSAK
jgi:hypothetical protein